MDSKYYTIYKITNRVNSKFYIGMHQTNDLNDGYMGSGKLISRAIKKHGIDNFTKEILFVFDNEQDMKRKEAEIVTEELCQSNSSYNLCPGGHGGFGYINNHERKSDWAKLGAKKCNRESLKFLQARHIGCKKIIEERISNGLNAYGVDPKQFLGKTHTKEAKKKIGLANSKHQSGKGNSQYGTMWITDGNENRKIKKIDDIPEGWYKGRKI